MENITLGDINGFLLNFASIITAGGVVCALALKIGKKVLDNSLDPFNKRIDEMDRKREEQFIATNNKINKLREELDDNSLNTMKNSICNEMIPLSERVSIFEKYEQKGGNGAVKVLGHKLQQEYEKELKKKER